MCLNILSPFSRRGATVQRTKSCALPETGCDYWKGGKEVWKIVERIVTLRGSRERARKNASPLGKLWGFAGLQGGSEIQMLRHKTITSMCSQLANTMQQWATLVLHPNPMKHMSKATLRKKRAFCAIWRPKATRYIKKTSTLTVFSLTICSNARRTKYPWGWLDH